MSDRIEPKWLYRLESTDPAKGLWYDSSGNLVWTIGEIPPKFCPNCGARVEVES